MSCVRGVATWTVSPHKPSVEIHESKDASYVLDVLWSGPISYGSYLLGAHANLPRADIIAEVFDFLCVPLRLSGFHKKLGVLQGREHLVNVPFMLFWRFRKIRMSSR